MNGLLTLDKFTDGNKVSNMLIQKMKYYNGERILIPSLLNSTGLRHKIVSNSINDFYVVFNAAFRKFMSLKKNRIFNIKTIIAHSKKITCPVSTDDFSIKIVDYLRS